MQDVADDRPDASLDDVLPLPERPEPEPSHSVNNEATGLQRAAAWLQTQVRGRRCFSSAQQANMEGVDEKTFLRRVHCVAEQSLLHQSQKLLQLLQYIHDGVAANTLEAARFVSDALTQEPNVCEKTH